MDTISRRHFLKGLGAGAGGIALSGLFVSRTVFAAQSAAKGAAADEADLVFHGHGFDPMISHVITGESIGLASAAGSALKLVSAPDAPEKVSKSLAPGAKVSLSFNKPGLYLLYDETTTRFDAKVGQVVARKSAKQFPLPAYTVVLVTDRYGDGLKPTDGRISIPDSYMTFEPWVTVVHAGDPINFTNNDMDMHVVMPSPEPMLMPKSSGSEALWQERMNSFAPLTLPGGGGTGVLTLAQPGLHHYYCPVHAAYSSTAYTFYPLKSYGGYPYIMDGVIVVLPS